MWTGELTEAFGELVVVAPIDTNLFSTDSLKTLDVLALLDCCYPGSAVRAGGNRAVQLLADFDDHSTTFGMVVFLLTERARKMRLFPTTSQKETLTTSQKEALRQWFGTQHYIYNKCVALVREGMKPTQKLRAVLLNSETNTLSGCTEASHTTYFAYVSLPVVLAWSLRVVSCVSVFLARRCLVIPLEYGWQRI
ncbi:hypothetical protein V1520DRAFT_66451 [Lipomyces starkeyi]|uniref:Uncharacterized protein n=1 Tax=Lipomyces starkeyi NRRL Y-11557 TaxID=675824 RepID=A0A1E3Q4C8_LIPST|nr:hypothetical protein LIPSTDRAFT_310347 [Lipomyces starkeyi NRRL Y-11557]